MQQLRFILLPIKVPWAHPRCLHALRSKMCISLCSADEDLTFFISLREAVNCKGLDAAQHRCKSLCKSAQS